MFAVANLENPDDRRKIRDAFKDLQLDLDPCLFTVLIFFFFLILYAFTFN